MECGPLAEKRRGGGVSMFYLAQPQFLYGLISIPILIGVYLWRRRAKRVMVSSSILWKNLTPLQQGGSRFQKLQTSLLFFIELLILLLILLAAVQPMRLTAQTTRPLTLILDNSVSMQARVNGASFQKRGWRRIDELLQTGRYGPVRMIFAGLTPWVSPRTALGSNGTTRLLRQWRCNQPSADLAKALETALALGERDSLILVVSDRAPPQTMPSGGLKWNAVGAPLANIGFVNAARTRADDRERCLIEVTNFADHDAEAVLQIDQRQKKLRFKARETKRLTFDIPPDMALLTARLSDDSFSIDNRLALYPPPARPCRVQMAIKDPVMRSRVNKALEAARLSQRVDSQAAIVFTDRDASASSQAKSRSSWVVQTPALKAGAVFQGPFTADYTHPLMQGVSWEGIIWDAGKADPLPGTPVLAAGDVALITDIQHPSGRRTLHIRINPNRSDLFRAPAWPSLIWNLLKWRIDHLPGLGKTNVRAGEKVAFIPTGDVDAVRVTAPDGDKARATVQQGVAHISTRQIGEYLIEDGQDKAQLAANLLSATESDLTQCRQGQWGGWDQAAGTNPNRRPLSWLPLIIALALLAIHLMVSKGRVLQ